MTGAKDANNLTLASTKIENAIELTFGSGDNEVKVKYDAILIDNADPYDTLSISWS